MPARLPCTQATTPTKAATHQTPAPRPAPIQDSVLAELMRNHRVLLCEAIRILGSRDRAEDVLQDAALRCLTSGAPDTAKEPRHYARRMVRNLALDHLRRDKKAAAHAGDETLIPACPAQDPEQRLAGKQALHLLAGALCAMPDRSRELFLRHRLRDAPQKQLATDFGLSPARVNTLIAEAHQRAVCATEAARGG